jgi:3-oxoacyl-[acyl-carrier protein] reductase
MRAAGEGGRVICIGSPTGQRGNFGQTNYSAAKAGIVGMVRTWALELKRAGITANAVIPVAATAMTATVPYFAAAMAAEANGEPMPPFFRHDLGFGTAEDVAGLIAFLSSDAAATVTGQAIGVGGDRIQIWTHPEAALTAYREGGWSYEALAEAWPAQFAGALQSVGERFPELPEEFKSADARPA